MAHTKLAITIAALATCCSTLPDVTARHYYPKAHTQLQVTQTLACSKDKKQIVPVLSFATPPIPTERSSAAGKIRIRTWAGACRRRRYRRSRRWRLVD
jgi:hypothetical protein